MKKISFFIATMLYMIFFNISFINAENIILNEGMYALELNNEVKVYNDNILIETIESATLLDFDKNYLLYNSDDKIYLYNIEKNNTKKISNKSYNGLIEENIIVYESDKNDDLICKNVIESIQYRNCYKLYVYDLLTEKEYQLKLIGNDNYLNDIENDQLVYTSIHSSDSFCNSLCSFVNLYNLGSLNNKILNTYQDITLDMSGNAFLDNDVVVFESIPNIYGCQNTQIFKYDIKEKIIDMITRDYNSCFSDDSEIMSYSNEYIIFNSKYNNYENNKSINYIYSIHDYKYKIIDNDCSYNDIVVNDQNNIYCLKEEDIMIYKIDTNSPYINVSKQYVALKEEKIKLIDNLEYDDDLSNKSNIKVDILTDLSDIGIKEVNVKLCDKYNNCSLNTIIVEIIDVDVTPPKIYCNELITIKSNQGLEINKYGFAIDNVDGKLPVEIDSEIDYSKGGNYIILLKSVDSSGNIGYMEVELVIYDNLSLFFIYYVLIFICIILVIIIYILRFKNKRYF